MAKSPLISYNQNVPGNQHGYGNPHHTYYKQYGGPGIGTAGQQSRSNSKNIVAGNINQNHNNPHNVYTNNTAYGCRENRDNSIPGG